MDTPKGKDSTYSIIPSEKNCALINEVRKFPALYDTSNPDYYVLAERNKAWLKVSENCSVPAEHCHLRWKSLRKRYAKERRRFKEILNGQRKPWALFPKMSFLANSIVRGRVKLGKRRKPTQRKKPTPTVETLQSNASEDDMLILDDNDEIVRTCKVEMPEEDEYIYEHLDDPDSALAIMKEKPTPAVRQTAIRTGAPSLFPTTTRIGGSGRIRKLTPKMQNSIIAKKLKQAQQILQHSSAVDIKISKNEVEPKIEGGFYQNMLNKKTAITNSVLLKDKYRCIGTVNPKVYSLGKTINTDNSLQLSEDNGITANHNEYSAKLQTMTVSDEPPHCQENIVEVTAHKKEFEFNDKPIALKVIKLKGRNPIIFSPEELPKYQSFLKGESKCPTKEDQDALNTAPLIKVKSVEHLNNHNASATSTVGSDNGDSGNLDIIHSLGLVRKQSLSKPTAVERISHQSYSRAYSWNRPCAKKTNKQPAMQEKIQPDSQTRDYEIEETWNDIKEEVVDDYEYPALGQDYGENPRYYERMEQEPMESPTRNMWNKLNQAKLELVLYQKKLLEEQHKKNLEYMKKEHDLKMLLLRAEIDLKRKQLNIML